MSEQKFINQLKQRNQNAFGQLLDNYEQKVFGTCISFIPNKEDAEDVAQEVFIEVFIGGGTFDKQKNFENSIALCS